MAEVILPRVPAWYLALPYIRGTSVHLPDRAEHARDGSLGYLILNDGLGQADNPAREFRRLWAKVEQGGVLAFNFAMGFPEGGPDTVMSWLEGDGAEWVAYQLPFAAVPQMWGGVLRKTPFPANGRDEVPGSPYYLNKGTLVYRPGGFGDGLVAEAVCIGLARKHNGPVHLLTLPTAASVISSVPALVYDPARAPQAEVNAMLAVQAGGYCRMVNISETYEGAILAVPGRPPYDWPAPVRRALAAHVNAMELACNVAEVPYVPGLMTFRASEEEVEYAARARQGLLQDGGTSRLIVWALSGSGDHKTWPHTAQAVTEVLLAHPEVSVALAGSSAGRDMQLAREVIDTVSQLIGPEVTRKRLACLGGDNFTIRDTFALAQLADIVVGPETGVHNAVAMLPVRQVVLLVHSTPDNLTRDWLLAMPVVARAPQYPCLLLHPPGLPCPQDPKTKMGVCASSIPVYAVVREVTAILDSMKEARHGDAAGLDVSENDGVGVGAHAGALVLRHDGGQEPDGQAAGSDHLPDEQAIDRHPV